MGDGNWGREDGSRWTKRMEMGLRFWSFAVSTWCTDHLDWKGNCEIEDRDFGDGDLGRGAGSDAL